MTYDSGRGKLNTEKEMFAKVIVDISADAVDRYFEYKIPEEILQGLKIGSRVKVPFGKGNAERTAYVIDISKRLEFDRGPVKEISGIIKEAYSVQSRLFELAAFMAREYGSTYSQALKTVLPVKRKVRKNKRRTDPVKAIGELSDEAAYISEVCEGMNESDEEKVLTEAQQSIVDSIIGKYKASVNNEGNSRIAPSFIYGVTGSGKTLVYIKLIEYMQSLGKQSIVLIPEISLTYQTVKVLSACFNERVAVLHSRLSEGERYEQYEKAVNGEIDIMVGPRSALFTAFSNLGLIIIDEEHENSYRSDMPPRYDAREVAAKLAADSGALLVMGSATPSLVSYRRAESGEYDLYRLSERAVKGALLPEVHVADMRKELERGNRTIFSERLRELIEDRLSKKEQIMLFLNRRGYAGFVSCRSCGRVIKCPHCDVSLTAHNSWYYDRRTGRREGAALSCHYCGHSEAMPRVCPECGSKHIAAFGVGTQKLESMVREAFPNAHIMRMDADTTAKKGAHEKILSDFAKGRADILIGTQMIVKGHDFPRVTLVGIISADLSLNSPEYDCAERTFGLITQAAGRAGRGGLKGDVVVQTYEPSHYAIVNAVKQDYESFYKTELNFRSLLSYPPCIKMLTVGLSCEDEAFLTDTAERLEEALFEAKEAKKLPESLEIIGPVNAGIYKVNDIYRKNLYFKHPNHDIIIRIRENVKRFVRGIDRNGKIKLQYSLE